MKKWKALEVTAFILSLAAAVISFQLLAKHLTGSAGPAWFDAGCTQSTEKGAANCAAVLASPYAYWPPKHEQSAATGTKAQGHIPVAFLGLLYYSTLTIWLLGVGRPSRARRWIHLVPLGLVLTGLAGSAYFVWVMLTKLDQWCPWCAVTHVLNALLLICLVLMWPWRRKVETSNPGAPGRNVETSSALVGAETGAHVPHPSFRIIVLTLVAIALMMFGQRELLAKAMLSSRVATAENNFNLCKSAIDRIKGDGPKMFRYWQLNEKLEIPLRSDDPVRWSGPSDRTPLDVVVFSDFACPSCKRLAEFLEKDATPLFGGSLRIVFKHYPLNKDCNPQVSTAMHPQACYGAKMAETALNLAGNEGFWRAHDLLFRDQKALEQGQFSSDSLAKELELDPDQVRNALAADSNSVAERIAGDAALGKQCGVVGTPSLFVDGRRVDTIMVTEIAFWDQIAEYYWNSVGQSRPPETKRNKTSP